MEKVVKKEESRRDLVKLTKIIKDDQRDKLLLDPYISLSIFYLRKKERKSTKSSSDLSKVINLRQNSGQAEIKRIKFAEKSKSVTDIIFKKRSSAMQQAKRRISILKTVKEDIMQYGKDFATTNEKQYFLESDFSKHYRNLMNTLWEGCDDEFLVKKHREFVESRQKQKPSPNVFTRLRLDTLRKGFIDRMKHKMQKQTNYKSIFQ